jgi:hypothetical protein
MPAVVPPWRHLLHPAEIIRMAPKLAEHRRPTDEERDEPTFPRHSPGGSAGTGKAAPPPTFDNQNACLAADARCKELLDPSPRATPGCSRVAGRSRRMVLSSAPAAPRSAPVRPPPRAVLAGSRSGAGSWRSGSSARPRPANATEPPSALASPDRPVATWSSPLSSKHTFEEQPRPCCLCRLRQLARKVALKQRLPLYERRGSGGWQLRLV